MAQTVVGADIVEPITEPRLSHQIVGLSASVDRDLLLLVNPRRPGSNLSALHILSRGSKAVTGAKSVWRTLTSDDLSSHVKRNTVVAQWLERRLG